MHCPCQRSDGLLSKVRNADAKKHLTFSLGSSRNIFISLQFPHIITNTVVT